MPAAESQAFARLNDGTMLLRQPDGSYKPVASETDQVRLDALADAEIEDMAAQDPDHPALDDAFWAGAVDIITRPDAVSVTLDRDVVAFFRRQGGSYQTRVNAVLRRYVQASAKDRA